MTTSAAALGVVALGSTPLRAEAAERPPNIVVILADDLGYADAGVQGCTDIPTPHIDAIARDGVRFTDAYVTCPICAPSRAGLITGRYQQRFGFDDNGGPDPEPNFGVPADQITLGDALRAVGYRTAVIGKWDIGLRVRLQPNDQGFDEFFGFLPGVNDYLPQHADALPDRASPIYRNTQIVNEPQYLTDAFGREAAAFIERNNQQPFLLYLPFNAVHSPLVATPQYLQRFEHLPPERQVYAAMVSAMDDAVGQLCAALRKESLEDNTLIFFLSDNGGASGQGVAHASAADNHPLGGRKGTFWEGGIRVPFFIKWPAGITAGQVLSQPVSALDILPTALAAAGATFTGDDASDGVNLLPLMQGKSEQAPHDALYWRYHEHTAIRRGDWKLIAFADGRLQLFNLRQDIGETTNLAEQNPQQVASLRVQLDAWNAELPRPAWVRRMIDEDGNPKYISLPIYEPQSDPTRQQP
ncbi:MAG: sulfatase [Phycisphaeraceae bacterium]|nr:sulfatase [Phycisphaeraceae bacterium]